MARRRTKATTNRCLEIIENFQNQQFEEFELQSDLDVLEVTSIWENPERLTDHNDYTLLFHVLSHQITTGNYEDPLAVCMMIVKSECPVKDSVDEVLCEMFTYLLTQLLKEERKKKIDYHVILSWLAHGDVYFCKENHPVVLNKKTYAVLKAIFLIKTWKLKHECYSCGCSQKQIIELFLGNNCSRLFEALHSIVKLRVIDLNPTFRRVVKSISDVQSIDVFCYYAEILQELRQCSAIENADEKSPSPLIQLTGLMCEMKFEDVPRACLVMYRLLVSVSEIKEKQRSAIETVLKSKLIPKIFECLTNSRDIKLESFNRASIPKFVNLIEKEDFPSTQKSNVFAPLQLLHLLYTKYDVWMKTKQLVGKKIDALNLSIQQGPVIVLYLLSLIYRYDASLIGHLVEILEKQYTKTESNNKSRVLLILEIVDKLGKSKEAFSAYFKENCIKTKLILATDLDCSENVEMVFACLPDLTPQELNQFLLLKTQSLSDDSWSALFRRIKDISVYVTSDDVWQCAVEKKNSDQHAIEFIGNQLKKLVEKKERALLGARLVMVFKQLRSVSPSTRLPPRDLLLAFPRVILSFTASQYSMFPQSTTNSLIPVLLLSFCLFFEGNEQKITELFRLFLAKIRKTKETCSEDSNPIQLMEQICEVIKDGKSPMCDIHFMRLPTAGGVETFLKTLNDVFTDESFRSSFPNPESFVRAKGRIVEMSSVLFEKLAPQIQLLGDRGKTPFCQLSQMIDKYITSSLPSSSQNSKPWEICERVAQGFACLTEKWNSLFAVPRVMNILSSSKSHCDLLKRLMAIVHGNKILLGLLKTKNDFTKLENLANQ